MQVVLKSLLFVIIFLLVGVGDSYCASVCDAKQGFLDRFFNGKKTDKPNAVASEAIGDLRIKNSFGEAVVSPNSEIRVLSKRGNEYSGTLLGSDETSITILSNGEEVTLLRSRLNLNTFEKLGDYRLAALKPTPVKGLHSGDAFVVTSKSGNQYAGTIDRITPDFVYYTPNGSTELSKLSRARLDPTSFQLRGSYLHAGEPIQVKSLSGNQYSGRLVEMDDDFIRYIPQGKSEVEILRRNRLNEATLGNPLRDQERAMGFKRVGDHVVYLDRSGQEVIKHSPLAKQLPAAKELPARRVVSKAKADPPLPISDTDPTLPAAALKAKEPGQVSLTAGTRVSVPRSKGGAYQGRILGPAPEGKIRVELFDDSGRVIGHKDVTAKRIMPAKGSVIPTRSFEEVYQSYGDYLPMGAFRANLNKPFPAQGFKLHISATPENMDKVAGVVLPQLRQMGLTHKIVRDKAKFMSSFSAGNRQQGKFITVYLPDNSMAKDVAGQISQTLKRNHIDDFIPVNGEKMVAPGIYTRYGQLDGSLPGVARVDTQGYIVNPSTGRRHLFEGQEVHISNKELLTDEALHDQLRAIGALEADLRGKKFAPDWVVHNF
ncbi:MAG: hypothetical protein ISR65_13995 [Bacteriovoracaceae bacterium]|nr:hypothetical protein [Bacteriovoracaceae bacterium]